MEDKYISCMVLHAVGDTVGFKNGDWEFHPSKTIAGKVLEKLYEFIDLGGVNKISLKDWRISDDTIMHMQTADALLKPFKNINELANNLKNNFIDASVQFIKDKQRNIDRYPGVSTMNALKFFHINKDENNWDKIPYNFYSGGSGAAMRSLCIGLAYYGKKNRHQLIQIGIESSRMTNNSAVGYLGGMTSALFAALAVENIKINEWPFILLELFENGTVSKYIKSTGRDVDEYERDHHIFIEKWHRYVEDKFDQDKRPIKKKMNRNLVLRSHYYDDNYAFIDQQSKQQSKQPSKQPGTMSTVDIGSGGDDSVIIAYDCLIDSNNNWEKLVIYSMLHSGDTDTTGSIAAGLYGILYGINTVPKNFTKNLEYIDILEDIGKKLYKMYYKK